jgi:hypothetical protein
MGHNLPKLLTKFDIPRPLATAKALGIDIPTMLALADVVIE